MYIMCLSKGLSAIQNAIDEGILPNKTLGFIPTAGDAYKDPYFVEESRRRLKKHGLKLIELDVTNEAHEALVKKLDNVDGIYIAGGNTFYLLYQLLRKDLVAVLREKVKAGFPYFGESAGAVLLAGSIEPAKPIDNPEDVPGLNTYDGLGLVHFFPLPHVGKEKYKPLFDKFIEDNKGSLKIIQYTDEQAVLTRDGINYEVLPSSIEELF